MINVVYKKQLRSFMVDAYFFGKRFRKCFRRKEDADRVAEIIKDKDCKLHEHEKRFMDDLDGMFS